MRFEHPEYLYGLLIIPLLILIYILIRVRQNRNFKRFADLSMRSYLMPMYSNGRRNFRFIVLLLLVTSLIFALANLQSGSKMEEVKREGIDLYLAVDVSNSMNAQDIVPSRLDRSKQAINRLIGDLKGDRIGFIVFADKAFVQLPITTDYPAARMFLSTVSTKSVASQGTAIGEAIRLAMKSFADNESSKAIVIISDGEDHDNESAVKAAEEAAKKGVRIYTIGMGNVLPRQETDSMCVPATLTSASSAFMPTSTSWTSRKSRPRRLPTTKTSFSGLSAQPYFSSC